MQGRWIKWREYVREYVLSGQPLCTAAEKSAWAERNKPAKEPPILAAKTGREDYGWRSLPKGTSFLGE